MNAPNDNNQTNVLTNEELASELRERGFDVREYTDPYAHGEVDHLVVSAGIARPIIPRFMLLAR